jgi:hypothetical protein
MSLLTDTGVHHAEVICPQQLNVRVPLLADLLANHGMSVEQSASHPLLLFVVCAQVLDNTPVCQQGHSDKRPRRVNRVRCGDESDGEPARLLEKQHLCHPVLRFRERCSVECGAAWDAASSLLHLRHDALVFLEGTQKLRGVPVLFNVRVLQVQLAGRVQLPPAELAERRVHPALVRARQHPEHLANLTEPEVAVALVCSQAHGTCLLGCVSCACAQRHRSAVLDVASRVTDALPIHPRKGHRHMPAFVILTEQ